MIQFYELQ